VKGAKGRAVQLASIFVTYSENLSNLISWTSVVCSHSLFAIVDRGPKRQQKPHGVVHIGTSTYICCILVSAAVGFVNYAAQLTESGVIISLACVIIFRFSSLRFSFFSLPFFHILTASSTPCSSHHSFILTEDAIFS